MKLNILVILAAALEQLACAVDLDVPSTGGKPASPLQYGIFIEEINHSGDGGLYAELIQNRAFQANSTATATTFPWSAVGSASIAIDTAYPISPALPYSVKVTPTGQNGVVGISNPGWWGINVVPQVYNGSFYVRGVYTGNFTVSLKSDLTNQIFASQKIPVTCNASTQWVFYDFTLNPSVAAPSSNNSFVLTYDVGEAEGPLSFNFISLFPPTFKDRPNGMRIDLMQAIADLQPSFFRFPGGNNFEGLAAPTHWQWNETIGSLLDRPGHWGVWGYYNTDGLGLDEFFNMAEDLDTDVVLGVWDGLYLNGGVVSAADLQPWVQDTLNELEYLLGDSSTTYGALRAANGYPEPRKLRYVEIGNEDNLNGGQSTYDEYRFRIFYEAIIGAYPDMNIISSSSAGPLPLPDSVIGSYHIYSRPDILAESFRLFNGNTSKNPTFADEVAVILPNAADESFNQSTAGAAQVRFPFWIGSVGEAIFWLGMEMNSAALIGTAYAPLFQNLDSYTWGPDMVSFTADPTQDLLSTSYSVFKLLSTTRFTQTRPATTRAQYGPAYWVTGENTATGAYVLKAAVYNSTHAVPFHVRFAGVEEGTAAVLTVLSAADAYGQVTPSTSAAAVVQSHVANMTAGAGGAFDFSMPALSVAVLETRGSQPGGFGGVAGYGGYGGCKNGGSRASYNFTAWVDGGNEGGGC